MKKIILYIAASIDNYISKPDGSVDWLHDTDYELKGEDYGYTTFYKSIDTTLMGNKTYQGILDFDVPFPYPGKKNYVFSRSKKSTKDDFVTFISGDIIGFIEKLKAEPGKDIWLIGGGEINTVVLENGMIDQIILTIVPVILGNGIPPFQKHLIETKFALEKSQAFKNGLVQLTFNKK
jgi:dihydrofolate reductase